MATINKITIDCTYDDFVVIAEEGCLIIDFEYWNQRYPSDLSALPISSTEIELSWVNNGTVDYDNICVERSIDGESFSEVAVIEAGENSFVDSGLSAGTQYFYKIRYYKS
jgi:hypothetical protein